MTAEVAALGRDGMLAASWRRRASGETLFPGGVRFYSSQECDLLDSKTVRAAVAPGVRLVINCAAYTDVDGAEDDEATATEVNGEAVGRLAQRCREVGAKLVHYSTDYVFNGRGVEPYPPEAPREPINAYGRSKARGEALIEESGAEHLIIRTSWLYSAHGKNFVTTIARLCRRHDSLRVVNDQTGRPSSADQLVETTRRLLDAGAEGIFHGCDAGQCTWFEFARAIGQRVNPACRIEPCGSEEFPRPAARPAYSVLDLSRTEALIGAIPHWRESLTPALDALLSRGGAEA